MAVTFSFPGKTSLVLERAQVFPAGPEFEPNQIGHLTQDNQAKVIDYGSTLELLKLKFQGLSDDNYDGTVNGVYSWFSSTEINWRANKFTLTDEHSVARQVRYWQKKFSMPEVANRIHEFSVTLLVVL